MNKETGGQFNSQITPFFSKKRECFPNPIINIDSPLKTVETLLKTLENHLRASKMFESSRWIRNSLKKNHAMGVMNTEPSKDWTRAFSAYLYVI